MRHNVWRALTAYSWQIRVSKWKNYEQLHVMKDGASHFTFRVRGGNWVFSSRWNGRWGTSVTVQSIGRLGPTEWPPRNFFFGSGGGGGAGLQVKTKNNKSEILSPISVLTFKGKMSSLVFLSCWSVCNILEPTLNSDTTWWYVGLKMMQELQQYSIPFITYRVIWYCVLTLQSPCMLSCSGKNTFRCL